MDDILVDALGDAADVIHLAVVVFPQDADQIACEENGVVVSHDEPPDVSRAEVEALLDDAGDPHGRPRPVPARVPEPGRVG